MDFMRIKMKKTSLLILRLLRYPSRWLGVDYEQFEILIITRLTMDFRNPPSGMQSLGNRKNTFTSQILMYVIIGALFGLAAFSVGDLVLGLTIFFSVVLVSLSMTLISEFTSVLFDPRDNLILLPRPVSNRTLLMYRLIHIQFYMGLIAIALSITGAIVIIFKYSVLASLIFLITAFLSTWIALLFTTFFYLLLSKIVNGDRFKDIISYAQIIMVVVVFGSYQLMPRLMDSAVLSNLKLHVSWWTYFFPPAWLAAIVKIFCFTDNSVEFILLALPGVIVPIVGAVLLIRFISNGFGNILSENSSDSSVNQNNSSLKAGLLTRLNNLFCISGSEKAGWNFTMSTIKRDRKFKQAVYPNFGILLVLAIILLKPDVTHPIASLQGLNDFNKYLFLMILGFSVNNAVLQLPYTDTPEAAWIYKALPFNEHGELLTGAIKAILTKFLVPTYAIILIPVIFLWGFSIILPVLLTLLGNIFMVLIVLAIQETFLPFTRFREMQQKGINSLRAILSMILMFLVAGGIYMTRLIPLWMTVLLCCMVLCFNVVIFRRIRNRKFRLA
jgi:hypothetical protein